VHKVTVKSQTKFQQVITAGKNTQVSDEPVSKGGDDAGFSPYELLLASLGSCTAITLRLYADRKGWPVKSTTVELSHEKVKASDCPESVEKGEQLVDVIRIVTRVEGDLDEAQKERLLEVTRRCPVHRTVEGGPILVNQLEVVKRQKASTS